MHGWIFLKQNLTEANVKNLGKLLFLLAWFAGVVQTGFSRGDKIIPQVVDGPGWATKFDLTNISSVETISKMRLSFFKNDGTKWSLQTNRGTGTDFVLNLQARQTLRIETLGSGSQVIAGYAVIYDEETKNTEYSEDFVLGISVFYVYSTSSGVADTVTVSVPQPTAAANAPMEMNDSKGVYSGLAFVDWSGAPNTVSIDLYSENGIKYGSTKIIQLDPRQQWSGYLDDSDLFPELKSFKGMAQITSLGPIAMLALLQTRAADGSPQYSTLVPVDRESLRRNSHMVLLQASTDNNPYMPIDFDSFAVDYFRTTGDPSVDTESWSWDIEYRYNSSDRTNRYLRPFNGAALSSIGYSDASAFDQISLPDLKALTYTTRDISLSGSALYTGYAFAVRTDIGNYAKVRILRIIDTTDSPNGIDLYNKDLVLEVCIYK
jgi:hypothetical protein